MKVFKKAVVMTMLLVFCGTILGGCSKNKVNTAGNKLSPTAAPTNTVNENKTNTKGDAATDEAAADNSDEVIKEGTIEKNGNVVLKQLAFNYNKNTIALSYIVDDQKIESLLGKANEIKSHTYSSEDGLNMDQLEGFTEKQYQYPGLVIKTINTAKDHNFVIFHIEIMDLKYPTVRNIKIGDSFEKLKEAYPEGNLLGGELSEQEDDFRYEPANYVDVMNFHIKDKKVDSIQIYSLID